MNGGRLLIRSTRFREFHWCRVHTHTATQRSVPVCKQMFTESQIAYTWILISISAAIMYDLLTWVWAVSVLFGFCLIVQLRVLLLLRMRKSSEPPYDCISENLPVKDRPTQEILIYAVFVWNLCMESELRLRLTNRCSLPGNRNYSKHPNGVIVEAPKKCHSPPERINKYFHYFAWRVQCSIRRYDLN